MSGPQCCENPPTLDPVSGSGHVEKVGGLDAYVSGSPDSKLCILLISEFFGYEAPKLSMYNITYLSCVFGILASKPEVPSYVKIHPKVSHHTAGLSGTTSTNQRRLKLQKKLTNE